MVQAAAALPGSVQEARAPALSALAIGSPDRDIVIVALHFEVAMSLPELKAAVAQLPADDLTAFARWFEEYMADAWDRRIEADALAGKLDEAGRRADADFEAGRCRPL